MIQRIKKVSPLVEEVFDPFVFKGSYRRSTFLAKFLLVALFVVGAVVTTMN